MKVLFLVPYPTEGASNRVRVEQFVPYLTSQGATCTIRPFVNKAFFKILYQPHRYVEKIFWFIVCTIGRILDLIRAFRYDIIFIHREAYPIGGPIFESFLFYIGKPIVFDFDDAIFLPSTSEFNTYIERFKKPNKVARIIEMSRYVIAGNDYLKDCALKYNKNVIVIPSSIDTEKYYPAQEEANKDVVIGWIGSNTTKNFLYDLEDAFAELSKRYNNLIIKIIGAEFHSFKLKNVVNKRWSLEDEVKDLQGFDIGIMPMPDNEWTQGKCAFKALLYMACGKPVVASPVGMNEEVLDDGINGFFARDKNEWVEKLSILIEDKKLRQDMGSRGRDKVVKNFSIDLTAPIFFETLKRALKPKDIQ